MLRASCSMNSSCAGLLRDVIDDGFLLAERLEVDPHVVQQMRDGVGLGLNLVHHLAPAVDREHALVGFGNARQQFVNLDLERG